MGGFTSKRALLAHQYQGDEPVGVFRREQAAALVGSLVPKAVRAVVEQHLETNQPPEPGHPLYRLLTES